MRWILTPTDVKEKRNINEGVWGGDNLYRISAEMVRPQEQVALTEMSDATAHILVRRPVFIVNKI